MWYSLAGANGEAAAARKRAPLERGMSRDQVAEAKLLLGLSYAKGQRVRADPKRAAELYAEAAAKGNVHGQYQLAIAYEGGLGIGQDYRQAMTWYEKAARQGDVRAQSTLGYMFDTGQGIAADPRRAREWYEKAAVQGDAFAQYNLASLYGMGRGVEQSDMKAFTWLSIVEANRNNASLKGIADAKKLVEAHLSSEQIAEGQRLAIEWLRKNGNR